MTPLRRLALALLLLQALQLLLPGAAVACLRVSMAPVAAVDVTAGDHAGDHAGHHAPAPADRGETGPDAPMHCPAATGCAVAAIAGVEATFDDAGLAAADEVVARDDSLPDSVGLAPEPPPPRG